MDESFGRYLLRELIGVAEHEQLIRAYDTERHREVALWLPAQDATGDPAAVQRLLQRAQALAELADLYAVPVLDAGRINDSVFVAMKLIDGTDLQTLLALGGPLPADAAVEIVAQAAAALDAIHGAGLTHGDLTPAALLVTPAQHVYLQVPLDFDAEVGADPGADVYALTRVLQQCLAPGMPAALAEVITTGLAADSASRFPSAGALATAARRALHGGPPVETAPPGPATPAAPARPAPSTAPRRTTG